jgi:retinol dehydrogenase 12
VTGGNGSLGREAIRHFLNLGAAKVILACRDAEKGDAARRDVEGCASSATDEPVSSGGKARVEVWIADLCSFESVEAFCQRAERELERIDVLVCNAGLLTDRFVEADGGWEAAIAVNVISTFLMAITLLPKMRETAMKFNTLPRIVMVSSLAHFLVSALTHPHYTAADACPRFAKHCIADLGIHTGQIPRAQGR